MNYFPIFFSLMVIVGMFVFFWRHSGPGSARTLGNKIASHIGIPRNVFHILLENGVKGSSRELLVTLEKSKLSLDSASVQLAPSLSRGIQRLEDRFGTQEMYEKAKPIIARLMAESEQKN